MRLLNQVVKTIILMKEVIFTETNHADAKICVFENTDKIKKECSNIMIQEGGYLYSVKREK